MTLGGKGCRSFGSTTRRRWAAGSLWFCILSCSCVRKYGVTDRYLQKRGDSAVRGRVCCSRHFAWLPWYMRKDRPSHFLGLGAHS